MPDQAVCSMAESGEGPLPGFRRPTRVLTWQRAERGCKLSCDLEYFCKLAKSNFSHLWNGESNNSFWG